MIKDSSIGSVSTPTPLQGKAKATMISWLLGFGALVAWNSILTVGDYYYEVFPHYHPARVLTLVYQPLAFGTTVILTYYEAKIDPRKRILLGYSLSLCITCGLLLVDLGTSGKGGSGNYVGICILVAGFGLANAFVEGAIVGELCSMQPEFLQSFAAGMAASGALTSGLRLVTKAAFDRTDHGLRKGVILFLSLAALIQLLCVTMYAFVFGKLPIVMHYHDRAALQALRRDPSDLALIVGDGVRLTKKNLISQNLDYAFDLWLMYALTLSIIPGFLYENTGHHHLGSWYPLVLIALFNLWDLIGRYVPLVECLKLHSRKGIMVACLSRLLLVPCFYFTAKYGDEGWMVMLVSVLGFTNGYLTICVVTVAPKGYKASEQSALGNLLVVFVLCGIFCGIALDWLWLIGNGPF